MKTKFFRKVLSNGMTVLLEKREIPIVSVAYAVRSGGGNETAEEKGIAHFIEHMLYKGTKKRSYADISEQIESVGGDLNGFTDFLVTAYWCKLPSKHLQIGLDVLTDMIKNSVFDEKEVEKERKVIFEEIKMRKDTPRIYVLDMIHTSLYKGDFGMDIIGTYKSMNSITRSSLVKRFKKVYQPNNMILAVVGDADFDDLVKFAEKEFAKEKTKGKPASIDAVLHNESKYEKRAGIDQANMVFAYHSPLSKDRKNFAAMVLTTLMAGGMSSRLFNEIREKRNLAYSVRGEISVTKDFSYSTIYIGTTKEKVEEIKKIILEEFENVSKSLSEKELKKIKDQIIGNYQISMEDSQDQLVNLLSEEINGNAETFYSFEKDINAVKLEDVKALAKVKDYSLFVLVPE